MTGKYALIIANTNYDNPRFPPLIAPLSDATALAAVLRDPELCAFDEVTEVLDKETWIVNLEIDRFLRDKKRDDLVLLYFSGHGIRDEAGLLYLAVKNTDPDYVAATGIEGKFVDRLMERSRSQRQLLILDCCYSGAIALGAKSAVGDSVGTAAIFGGGIGRVTLTASDEIQVALGGNDPQNSLFTRFLVRGLQGEADPDRNNCITVDTLYNYAYEQVKRATPNQSPKRISNQQGDIILRQITRMDQAKPVPLPDELLEAVHSRLPEARLGAVQVLAEIVTGRNLGLARSARDELERMEVKDDSTRVRDAVSDALWPIRTPEERRQAEERRHRTERRFQQQEMEQKERAEQERIAQEARLKEEERRKQQEAEAEQRQRAEQERIAHEARLKEEEARKQQAAEVARRQREEQERLAEQARRREEEERKRRQPNPAPRPGGAAAWLRVIIGLGAAVVVLPLLGFGLFVISALMNAPVRTAPAATAGTPRVQSNGAAAAYPTLTAQAASTSIALESAATADAASTAQARGTSTAFAVATGRAQAEFAATAYAQATPYYAPHSSTLAMDPQKDFVKIVDPGVQATNFIVEATFSNPYDPSLAGWDYGFAFRSKAGDDEFRIFVRSTGQWGFVNHTPNNKGVYLQNGTLSNLRLIASGSNKLKLICRGSRGLFYVNGVLIAELDLSARTGPGAIQIGTGFVEKDEVAGHSTVYKDFTIWKLP